MSNNNNTTSSAVEELRLQQQCFRDEGDSFAEDALQVRIEDSQESSRQQETPVAATAAPAAAPMQIPGLQSRMFTPRADPTDLFDRSGRVWCEYHGRFTPSHSTKYCSARQAHERGSANPGPSRGPKDMRSQALQALATIASGRSSSGGVQKHQSKGKGKRKNQDRISRLATAALDRIAKLEAEKGSSKNLPARGPLRKDPNDDEGGPDSGASKQLTV
ncbi:hypothetical protein KCU67_g8705, partial [Aureobasidium melanogenum]